MEQIRQPRLPCQTACLVSLSALSACLPCQPVCLVSLSALSACLPCQPVCLVSLSALSAHLPCWPVCFVLCLLITLAFRSVFLPLTSKNIDCLTGRTACLVCFNSIVNGRSKNKKPIMSCSSSGHITKLKQSIFAPFNIYGFCSSH